MVTSRLTRSVALIGPALAIALVLGPRLGPPERRPATPSRLGAALATIDDTRADPCAACGPLYDVTAYGARGDGRADDAAAIARAVAAAVESHGTVYLPAGVYRYGSLPIHITGRIRVQGAGKRQSILEPLPFYPGYAVRIDDCWRGNGERPTAATIDLAHDSAGVVLRDFSIVGDRHTVAHGIQTYDRVDFLQIENVDLVYLRGTALELGAAGGAVNRGLVRESQFRNVFVRLSGDRGAPPLIISTGAEVRDGTNQLEFFGCGLVENFAAAVITNGNRLDHDTRRIQFYGLMLHGRNRLVDAPADDLLRIEGRVADLTAFGLRANGSHFVHGRRYATVRFAADAAGNVPRRIQLIGTDTRNCPGNGFVVDAVENLVITGMADPKTIAGDEIVFAPRSVRGEASYLVTASGKRSVVLPEALADRVRVARAPLAGAFANAWIGVPPEAAATLTAEERNTP